jgi:hypothetical protein
MRKNIIFPIVIIGTCLISGCEKKADNANPLYVGYWTSIVGDIDYTLIIKDNSDATYTISQGAHTPTVYSGTARIRGEILKIGSEKFHIDKEPSTSACGACTLVLDGIELRQ